MADVKETTSGLIKDGVTIVGGVIIVLGLVYGLVKVVEAFFAAI